MKQRLPAIDWMRGIAMVLMAIDHASAAFNAGRLSTDSFFLYTPGTALPAAQFWTRWITHICAPTFLFLAGTAVALSIAKRLQSGSDAWSIDRHLLTRGLIIAALDPILISLVWYPGQVLLQVLFAIGVSLMLLVPLRRLRTVWLVVIAAGFLAVSEILTGIAIELGGGDATAAGALLLHGGMFRRVVVGYPVLPWLALMVLGFAFGRYLHRVRQKGVALGAVRRMLWIGSAIGFILFLVIRGLNSYGNMLLLRYDNSLIQWLHVSKYPPGLSFVLLQLSIMGIILAIFFKFQELFGERIGSSNPVLVFGQTALFFYVLHILVLEGAARILGVHMRLGLGPAYLAAAAALVVLYPCCLWYRNYKRSHPRSWTRYI